MSPTLHNARTAARISGVLYLTASVGFLVVFGWLATAFGYPDVLDRPAGEVLPKLLALGAQGRAVWAIYAVLPLLLVPAALLAQTALEGTSRTGMRVATTLQVVAAMAMTVGLARWPSVQWRLAEAWLADPSAHAVLAVAFDAANVFLGNWIGEYVGELTLYGSFVLMGRALYRAAWEGTLPAGARWVGVLGLVAGVVGEIGAFRNVTSAVQLAADASNVLLPLFLISAGIVLAYQGWRRAPAGG